MLCGQDAGDVGVVTSEGGGGPSAGNSSVAPETGDSTPTPTKKKREKKPKSERVRERHH